MTEKTSISTALEDSNDGSYYAMPDLKTYEIPPERFGNNGKTGLVTRFAGNTLFGRLGRSMYTSTENSVRSVVYLSQWGDINPVTLANVRFRDSVFFGAGLALGGGAIDSVAEATSSAIIDLAANALNYGGPAGTFTKIMIFQGIEQVIDKTLDTSNEAVGHITGRSKQGKLQKSGASITVFVKVTTPFIAQSATIKLVGERESKWTEWDIGKAWFLPYLEATGREFWIKRSGGFDIAEMHGPAIKGDWHLALTLLTRVPSIIPVSTIDEPVPDNTKGHILITTVAISPYRAMWSQSKVPSAAKLYFHLLDQAPGLVIPVHSNAPVVSWVGMSVEQMHKPGTEEDYIERQCCALEAFAYRWADEERLQPGWKEVFKLGIRTVAESWSRNMTVGRNWMNELELNRAGTVMLYY